MTRKELSQIASMVANSILESQDEIVPLDEVKRRYGWSKSFLYSKENQEILGAMKAGGKVFFSIRNINNIIRGQKID